VDEPSGKTCLTSILIRELAEFRITASHLDRGFRLEELLPDVLNCRVVKEDNRRQVYHLQTARGGYFLKRSSLVRTKDRLRHFLLPRRRWAEWRNLHRLNRAQIPAARPVARGISTSSHRRSFFVLTEEVPGTHIAYNSIPDAHSLGEYAGFLLGRRVYHADLNRKNLITGRDGRLYLLDVQEAYFLPWLPHRLKISNLGRVLFNFCSLDNPEPWAREFLAGYRGEAAEKVTASEVIAAARRHQDRRFRSRSKRCCKNSTQFEVLSGPPLRGYKRRDFNWTIQQLRAAQQTGQVIKPELVFAYQGVCIKQQRKKIFHRDRCLASWKMSQALQVRGIRVPRALGYFAEKGRRYFLNEFFVDSLHLNEYLSALTAAGTKRLALKKLASWLRHFHDAGIWQRDFKSNNMLFREGELVMVDLDDVKIRRLSEQQKIINLAQLNASVSNAVTLRDRLRFYHYYAAGKKPTRRQRREVYRQVWQISRTKKTDIYNLDLDGLWRQSRTARGLQRTS
jgi:tRNA A-37 threonylcarbamoyl transferase component Bud32